MAYDQTFQLKVFKVLGEAFDTTLSSVYGGRLHAQVPPAKPVFPCAVYQSQDGGGKNDDYISHNGWQGLITFRSLDTTLSGALDKLIELGSYFQNVTYSGVSISMKPDRPIQFPIERISTGNIYTVGIIVAVGIYPN